MKKLATLFLSLSMVLALTACGSRNGGSSNAGTQSGSAEAVTEISTEALTEAPVEGSPEASTEALTENGTDDFSEASTEALTENPTEGTAEALTESLTADTEVSAEATESAEGNTLVVYFSATGNTEEAANYIAAATGADMFELVPAEPYTDADLNYNDDSSRVVYEHDNPDARDVELVESAVPDWESYDTVFIGYPIWWGIAAWPVDAFIEANDFTGKTVIPFCTSASSGLGESGELLAEAAGTGEWMEGIRFSSSVSEEDVQTWLEGMGL